MIYCGETMRMKSRVRDTGGVKEQGEEEDRQASSLTLGQKVAAAEMPEGQVQGERSCGANLSTQVRK